MDQLNFILGFFKKILGEVSVISPRLIKVLIARPKAAIIGATKKFLIPLETTPALARPKDLRGGLFLTG